VVFHGALDVGFGGAESEVESCVESIELEEIAMRLASRRAGAPVAGLVKVVAALVRAVGELLPISGVFREFAGVGRQIVKDPVDPSADGRIGIVHDEREGLRSGGRIGPVELGRNVGAIAGELLGNRFARRKGIGGDLEGHGSSEGAAVYGCLCIGVTAQSRPHRTEESGARHAQKDDAGAAEKVLRHDEILPHHETLRKKF
jgi:hypothetical protein